MTTTKKSKTVRGATEARSELKKRKISRRYPPYRFTRGPEIEYLRAVNKAFDAMEKGVAGFVDGLPKDLRSVGVFDAKMAPSKKKDIEKRVRRSADKLKIKRDAVTKASRVAARKLDRSNKSQHVGAIKRASGIKLEFPEKWRPKLMRDWARENADLIEGASARFREKLSKAVSDGVSEGLSVRQIQARIMKDYVRGPEVAKTRRKLRNIIKDQSAKLQSRLTAERHAELGVKRYVWRTSQDERVRATHEQRHSKRFRPDRSIEPQLRRAGLNIDELDGHPGEPPNCRCWREPILSEV